MMRAVAWAGGAMLVAFAVAGFMPLSLWSDELRRELEEQIAHTASLTASASGAVTLTALPLPRVSYSNVRIGHADGSVLVSADRATAELSIARLLMGDIEFTGLRLLRPQLSVDASGDRPEQSQAVKRAIQAPSASAEARQADGARLGGVTIVDGSLRLRAGESVAILVEGVHASIDWPQLGSTATLSGRGLWRGERIDMDLLLGKPGEVLRGEKSPFTAKLSSRLIDISADGSLSGGARWMFDARLAASSERLAQLFQLFDVNPPIPGRLARLAVNGRLRALPQSATLSDLKLTIDGNAFDGSLTLLPGERRPKISGTLATRSYALRTPDSGAAILGHERQWSKDAIGIGRLDLFDADLRVSATQVSLGRFNLSDAGFVIALDDGGLEVTTAGANAFGGAMRGRWRFNSRAATPELEASGSFKNISIPAMLRGMGHANIAAGVATGEFNIQTRGSNVHAMMQHASGSVRANVRAPEIIGVDLERALRRTERRPLSIVSELRTGQTTFTAAEVEAKIDDGLLTLKRAVAAGPGAEVSITGDASLPDRTMDFEITARQPRPAKAGDSKDAPAIILDIEGPWRAPALSIDPESLIRRSEAAAPLWRRTDQPTPAVAPVER